MSLVRQMFEAEVFPLIFADLNARRCSLNESAKNLRVLHQRISAGRKKDFKTVETKINQDTIIMNIYRFTGEGKNDPPFLRISFYLNNLHQLSRFNTQQYNQRLQTLQPENYRQWTTSKEGYLYLKADPDIRILKQADPLEWRSAFAFDVSVSAQNYHDLFVPSINAGIGIVRTRRRMRVEYWLGNEYDFSFGRNAAG